MLFYEKWRVVFTCCETSWLKRKKRGAKCKLWHLWQQKSKTLVGCARVYTRGKDTYSIFVFDTVLSELKDGSPLASCKANKTTKSCLLMSFCKLSFSELRLLAAKTSLFRHFFPLWGNISPYTNREMFRNLVMRGHTKTTTNCVNTICRLNRMMRALLFQ